MADYIIIETDDGLTVVELPAGKTAREVATAAGGTLVDEGPYRSYEDACDAMRMLPSDVINKSPFRE